MQPHAKSLRLRAVRITKTYGKLLIKTALLISVSMLLLTRLYAQASENLRSEIEVFLNNEYSWVLQENSGMLVGVLDRDSVYFIPFGTEIPGQSGGSDQFDLLVETGSLAKIVMAEILLSMEEEGSLNLDEPIVNTPGVDSIHSTLKEVCLRDLLLHTSGLPKYPNNMGAWEQADQDPFGSYPREALLELLQNPPQYPVKKNKGYYSHINYALAEIILEQQLQQDFSFVVSEYFKNITDERVKVVGVDSLEYYSRGKDMAGVSTSHRRFLTFAGSEGFAMSPEAMMDYMEYLVGRKAAQPPEALFEADIPSSLGKEIKFGYGTFRADKKKFYPIFVQNGRGAGHSVFFAFIPENQTGVFVITNSPFGSGDLGMLILRMINHNWKKNRKE